LIPDTSSSIQIRLHSKINENQMLKTDENHFVYCFPEDLPAPIYRLPDGWSPEGVCVFFIPGPGGPALYPLARVDTVAGVPVPLGPRGEFPIGGYVLADLEGRVEFVGPWEQEFIDPMLDHIANLRRSAQAELAPERILN
jgi:hypothetical protein